MFRCVTAGEAELIVKKSRFIAVSAMASDRESVKRTIDNLRKKYPDATHICYAFIADERGDEFGYDDDGEPSGTAGKPIYAALSASGASKSMIAVIRYFGGIKLGAGGLTRAYRQSASELIEKVGMTEVEKYYLYDVECDGDAYKKISSVVRNSRCKCEQIMYNDKVSFVLACPSDDDAQTLLKQFGATYVMTGERYE